MRRVSKRHHHIHRGPRYIVRSVMIDFMFSVYVCGIYTMGVR